ncbi:helix-turn-helix transcriptional regulator [Oceanisphaera sp.]|uniref:helix-turn-helix transcriptional regulator n=1 Tax=Oceanisphaera sp. TaxID=1929979 RepID=UPI003A8E426F
MAAESGVMGALGNRADNDAVVQQELEALHLYGGLVEGLVELFGRHCEVVLYSLTSPGSQVLKAANSGQQPGTPMAEPLAQRLLELQEQQARTLTYFTQSRLGAPIKSSIQLLRDAQGVDIGLLSINVHLDVPLHELMADFMPRQQQAARAEVSPENFNNNVEELVTLTVERTIEAINADAQVANNAKNKQIVTTLYEKGIFDIKDAIAMVSSKLNISKHTVYLYIRQKKRDDEEPSLNHQETS